MKVDVGVAAMVLAIALGCLWSPVVSGGPDMSEPSVLNEPTVGDLLERIERYQQVRLQDPESFHRGLQRMNSVIAELELALLEVYGPEPVRNRRRGLESMVRLHQGDLGHLPEDVRQLLRVLAASQQMVLDTERECHELEIALDQERREHRETQDRLKALRMIERQLEDAPPESEAEIRSEDNG